MKSRPLLKALLFLALAGGAVRADYISSTVSIGAYLLDAQDGTHDGNFYPMERINVSALKDGVGLRLAYGHSDLYEMRPNTYQNSHRLALANVSYDPGLGWLKVSAGRDFAPLLHRSLYYDGGAARLQYRNIVKGELFGGYGVPTAYNPDIADFDSDKALIGGKMTYTPLSRLLVQLDGLVNGRNDDGTLGGAVQGIVNDRVTLLASSAFRLDSSYFSNADVAALVTVRRRDQLQVRYGIQEQKIDSTRNYDYFVNKSHQFLLAGYLYSFSDKITADVDYGMLMYDDSVGQMASLKVTAFGLFARVGQEYNTVANALDLRLGYSNLYWNRFGIAVAGGYTQYDLSLRKTGLQAFDFSVQPSYRVGRGLEVIASYEYLHNRLYESDNRFFLGVKEAFFRGLSK